MLKIEMIRGDYKKVKFKLEPKEKTDLIKFDDIYITCKKNHYTEEFIFQKRLSRNEITKDEEGNYHFEILPEDTEKVTYSTYVFDIELYKESNPRIKQSFLGELIVEKEVTFVCNEGGVNGE